MYNIHYKIYSKYKMTISLYTRKMVVRFLLSYGVQIYITIYWTMFQLHVFSVSFFSKVKFTEIY